MVPVFARAFLVAIMFLKLDEVAPIALKVKCCGKIRED
jgi:hypothetical protein